MPTADGAPLFSVVLKDETQLQWGPLGQALATYRHVPAMDTIREAKSCWGILAEKISEGEAKQLQLGMENLKINTLVMPYAHLKALSPAKIVSTMNFSPEGFVVSCSDNSTETILSNQIQVIAVAALSSSITHKTQEKQGSTGVQKILSVGIMLTTGLPIKIGPKDKIVEKTTTNTNLSFVMDIVIKESGERLRIIPDNLNFSFLKDRMVHGAMGNFRVLLTDLVSKAPQARQSRGSRMLLAGQSTSQMGYETLADLEKETRWLSALHPV